MQLDRILPGEDVDEFKELKKKINKASKQTEYFRNFRRKTVEEGKKGGTILPIAH